MVKKTGLIVLAILCLGAISGCLLFLLGTMNFPTTLKVAYEPAEAVIGPLSRVAPLRVTVLEFKDVRADTDEIGRKRYIFGPAAAIQTQKPVPIIIHEAFVNELLKNGIIVSTDAADAVFTGEITNFSLDVNIVTYENVEFTGTVGVNLNVLRGKANQIILSRHYQGVCKITGTYQDQFPENNAKWEMIMNTALERMVSEMNNDASLVATLKSVRGMTE
jgi:hypothetical protein